jgi:hypothetical protein
VAKALLVLINNPTQHQAATEAAARFVSSATGATGKLLALIRQHDQN